MYTEELGQQLRLLLFPWLFFKPSHISGEWQQALVFLNSPKLWDFEQSPPALPHGCCQGARDRQLWAHWSKWLDKIQGLCVFYITKKSWYCHCGSLKQSCSPTQVLFPRSRRSQVTGDGFFCTALKQVQLGLSPPARSPSASHTCSISSLFGLFLHSQLLCSLLLGRCKNLQRTAKHVMTSVSLHLCFAW